ncbi:MAG: hypothetical protein IJ150_01790 [Bacteroidales bacterium]|nr:hypothetical protein [Bacteroidales bacterium]
MRNLFIRKKIVNFNNKTVDEILQRAVKASGSLKNNAFSKYVSDFTKSAGEFHKQRKVLSSASYTTEIRQACKEADEAYRKIKLAVEYSLKCLTGQMLTSAQKIQPVIKLYGNIPQGGCRKKFADYDALIIELKKDAKALTTLQLDSFVTKIAQLTTLYREKILARDVYRSGLKGKRNALRTKAINDFVKLRNIIEAFAEMNGTTEVSEFISTMNETFIYLGITTTKKE